MTTTTAPNVVVTGRAGGRACREPLVVEVLGTPAPQGSKRHVGRGILVESSAKVRPWREAVKHAALEVLRVGPDDEYGQALRDCWPFGSDPVEVRVVFRLPRPRAHFRTGRRSDELREDAPRMVGGRPDLDKLLRSTLDALGEAGVWRDDAQVARVSAVKVYADGPAGCSITVGGAR